MDINECFWKLELNLKIQNIQTSRLQVYCAGILLHSLQEKKKQYEIQMTAWFRNKMSDKLSVYKLNTQK